MPSRVSRIGLVILLAAAAATAAPPADAGPAPESGPWLQYADVGLGGFDAAKLEAVRQRADEADSGAVFVVRNGIVVVAWGDVERVFKCHSVRKSLLSALYGTAVERGQIDLGATLASLGIDDVGGLTEVEKQATVEQLLQARSGIYHPAAKEPGSMKEDRPERGSAAPGERFWYNNWDFNTAGYVFEKLTGRGIFEAFAEDLAEPLGMEDFRIEDTVYQYERSLSRIPAYAFRLSARDAARLGLLYLRRGKWDGRQLVPADWIRRSWTAHSDLGDGAGYGYMWWIYGPGTNPGHPELATYAARGTGGQLIAVVPQLDLVIVHRADTDFSRGVDSGTVWEIVPGIIDAIDGPPRKSRRLEPLDTRPFSKELPALSFPQVVSLSADQLDRYAGSYRVGEGIDVTIERLGDILVGSMTGRGEADFFPVGETEFWGKAVGAMLKFDVGDNGEVVRARVVLGGQEIVAVPATEPAPK